MAGKISAIGAIVFGLLFAGLAALQLGWDVGLQPLVPGLAAALLLLGGYRTLRQMSGGLRLLAGAWGVAAGLMLQPMTYGVSESAESYSVPLGMLAAVLIKAAPFIALGGLALVVLHKEKKA